MLKRAHANFEGTGVATAQRERSGAEILQHKVAPTWQCKSVALGLLTDSFQIGSHQERSCIGCVGSKHPNKAVAPLLSTVATVESGEFRRSSRRKSINESCGGALKG